MGCGVRGERKRKRREAAGLRTLSSRQPVCAFPQPRVGFTKGGPEPPARFGDPPPRLRRRVNSPSPQPPTVCKRPPLWGREQHPAASSSTLSGLGEGSLALCAPDPGPHGSAARLGGRAGGSSQVKLLLSPCEAWSSWKMPRRDGRSCRRRRLQPLAAAPLPFRFH